MKDSEPLRLYSKNISGGGEAWDNKDCWLEITLVPGVETNLVLITFHYSSENNEFFTNTVVHLDDVLYLMKEVSSGEFSRRIFPYTKMDGYLVMDPNSELIFDWSEHTVKLSCKLGSLVNNGAAMNFDIKEFVGLFVRLATEAPRFKKS